MSAINAKTICVVIGEASSMAAIILSACDEKYGTELSEYLIHNVQVGFRSATLAEAVAFVKSAIRTNNNLLNFLEERLKIKGKRNMKSKKKKQIKQKQN